MRYGRIMVCFLTAIFLAVAVFAWKQEPEPQLDMDIPLSVQVTAMGEPEEIECWKNEEGEYFVFLPSYADMAQVRVRIGKKDDIRINQQQLIDGMSCDVFQTDVPYILENTTKDGTQYFSITFVQSGNMPSMYIDVRSGNMDYIHAEKGNEESGRLRLYSAEGALEYAGNLKAINGRGNYTWEQDKKPYSLTLSEEANLLGLGAARKWILFSNPGDPSHLRNKFVFDYADAVGMAYSPDSTWVDLYLNGEYAGLYLLSERNEIHPQRVDLAEESSFLVSLELESRLISQGYPFITTGNGSALRIHHSATAPATLEQIWQSAENAILSEDGIDPVTGKHWTELIDLDSWVKKYLIEEIFGNLDAGAVSQFFYGNLEDSKIFAGPVWDYDMSMGNLLTWQIILPTVLSANRADLGTDVTEPWFYALYQKDSFYHHMVGLYQTEFLPLMEEFLNTELDRYLLQIIRAAEADHIRWSTPDTALAIDHIRTYMTQRLEFLSSIWIENESYFTVLVDTNEGYNTACYAVKPGGYVPELPAYNDRPDVIGWYDADTDKPFDAAQPIYQDMRIYLKIEASGENQISPLQVVPSAVAIVFLIVGSLIDGVWAKRNDKRKNERTNCKIPS